MKRMNRYLAALLAVALCLFSGPGAACAAEAAYTGTITLIDLLTPDAERGELESGPALCFEALLAQWQADHPQIELIEKQRTAGEIDALACIEHLPDVFMLNAKTGRTYARYGYIQDLTSAIAGSEDAQRYDYSLLAPFLYYGRLAAFPVLAQSHSLVVYDARAWKRAGFEGFPNAWDALRAQWDGFAKLGYQGIIAFGNKGGAVAIGSVLSPALAGPEDMAWFQRMIDMDPSSLFRDDAFIDALIAAKGMLADETILADNSDMTPEAALKRFIRGDFPALLVRGDNVYRALDEIKAGEPELYENLDFAALPVESGDLTGNGHVPTGIDCGLYINAEVARDPDKLEACVALCEYLTGPAYADAMARQYGRSCFAQADETAWEQFYRDCDDPTLLRLARFTSQGLNRCADITRFLHGSIWTECGSALQKRIRADREADPVASGVETIANSMQNLYEKYYLGAEDFSKTAK